MAWGRTLSSAGSGLSAPVKSVTAAISSWVLLRSGEIAESTSETGEIETQPCSGAYLGLMKVVLCCGQDSQTQVDLGAGANNGGRIRPLVRRGCGQLRLSRSAVLGCFQQLSQQESKRGGGRKKKGV